jgi:hypothetical protein
MISTKRNTIGIIKMLHLKKNILFDIKQYVDDINDNVYKQPFKRQQLKKGWTEDWIGIYSKKDPHPITECSEYYLDDKEFILEAVKIDPECIKYASKRLKEDSDIIKVVIKKNLKIAKKYISKEILKKLKSK